MIQAINATQNTNFKGRLLTTAANHLRKNANHYIMNTAAFTTGAILGRIKGVEDVLATKVVLDGLEAVMAIFRNQRTSNGFANFNNPVTNTMIWVGKGTWKLLEKVFSKNVH